MHDLPYLAQVQLAKLIGEWWAGHDAKAPTGQPKASREETLRRVFGARLVRLGERLARTGPSTETAQPAIHRTSP